MVCHCAKSPLLSSVAVGSLIFLTKTIQEIHTVRAQWSPASALERDLNSTVEPGCMA